MASLPDSPKRKPLASAMGMNFRTDIIHLIYFQSQEGIIQLSTE